MLETKTKQNKCANPENENENEKEKKRKRKYFWFWGMMMIIWISQRKDELIIFVNVKVIEMEENQQMISEQGGLNRRIRNSFVNWFEDDKTEKSIASHVNETFILTVENQLNIDIDMKFDGNK